MSDREASQANQSPPESVADAVAGNWVDRRAPIWMRPYMRLSRWDRPIGTWLLFIPCLWGLMLAIIALGDPHAGDLWIAVACAIGAVVTRGAGCTWNDIADRNFDAQVQRTKSRPLPAKQVTLTGAAVWMVIQGLIGLLILLSLPLEAVIVGLASISLVLIYPFAKRFTYWPQLFLGLAFNWGILLAWTAHAGAITLAPMLLYASGIAWTLFYDTIYAHQDTEDDAMIGVKSTARLFGSSTPGWLVAFLVLTIAPMGGAILLAVAHHPSVVGAVALLGPVTLALHMARQIAAFDADDERGLMMLFRSNRDAGLLPVAFLVLAMLLGASGLL